MLELRELSQKTLEIFGVSDVTDLKDAFMKHLSDTEKAESFCKLIEGDLTKDWLQMIFQYYEADREEKKQDYTPKCLGTFLSRLVGESTETIDMCAGSGALTIQRWLENPNMCFLLYEIDENVIPYLLYNMMLRNISGTVYLGDVLQNQIEKAWMIRKGDRFGNVISI